MEENEQMKDIEIITGDGTDLIISEVQTHIPLCKPRIKEKKQKNIIIPQVKNLSNT